jgi:RimJ/RimL family protein N-acetyltransferase
MNDPECMRLLNREHVITLEEHERWFESIASSSSVCYFAIETPTEEHIGNVWLVDVDRRHRKAEVRIVIGADDSRGRGRGARAIALVATEAFDGMQLHRLYAYVLAFNTRAQRAFERAGFALEGTLRHDRRSEGQWTDALLLARVADNWKPPS